VIVWKREDFREVPGVPGVFYCPACNMTNDDYDLPSCGKLGRGPCHDFGTGQGSLTAEGVENYLESLT
jgi:hypothetical protein